MSLLLEALKKAERAKEEAQRRAGADASSAELRLEPTLSSSGEPRIETQAEVRNETRQVLTRAELPDIKQPLEILSDHLAAGNEVHRGRAVSGGPPAAEAPPIASAAKADAQAAERSAARNVFEAKLREPNPRLPFYVALALLGAFALSTVGYFWYQLRPQPALVNVDPPRTGSELSAEVAPVRPAESQVASSVQGLIPGLPPAQATSAQPSSTTPVQRSAEEAAPAAPLPPKASARSTAPRPPTPRAEPARARPVREEQAAPPDTPAPRQAARAAPAPSASTPSRAPQIHPKVQSAYSAYLSGDLAAARADYQEALRDGSNRDALLGLAAVDVRLGRHESAEAAYLRLLQLDPNDAHAQAGLIALRTGRLDPLATESRVKSLLAADPGANVLHFTLGNQLARQARWAEAQQEYFKAFTGSPSNADFAYNLAVSLDHLRQPKLALEYYQRAIALAESGGGSFDLAAARARAAQLSGL